MQGRDAHTVRLENNIGSRTVDVAGDVNQFAGPDHRVCVDEQFSGQFLGAKEPSPGSQLRYSPAS